jgi:lysophospholipase L1-like esterase
MKFLVAFVALFSLVVPVFSAPEKWEKEIAGYEKADAAKPPAKGSIVFIGSSSIRLWKTLTEDFPRHKVLNRGFGGSQIEDSTAFADRIIFPYEPSMIVLYAGGNDINAGKSASQVFEDFKAFVAKVRTKLPEVEIAYISIAGNPKRWAQIDKVKEANRLIEEYTKQEKHLKFINVFSAMMGADGLPKPDIFVADNLHMNPKGYAIWKEFVGPFLPKP